MLFVPSDADRAALVISAVAGLLVVVAMFALSWFMPKGQINNSPILASRETGQVYVRVGSTLHETLNVASARLISGSAAKVTFVPTAEIKKYPQGGLVGIPGAPNDLTVSSPATATWSICDSIGSTGASVKPVTTVLDGELTLGDQARVLSGASVLLATYDSKVWLIRDGRRSQVDLSDRRVGLALGLPVDAEAPPMSKAVYDALPPTPPLTLPTIKETGKRAGYSPAGRELLIGSVVTADTSAGKKRYVVLGAGLQEVGATVAQVVRSANSLGQDAPPELSADVLSGLPQTRELQVDQFPSDPVQVVDRGADPVACVRWERNGNDPAARTSVIAARRLPVADEDVARVRRFVRSDSEQSADQVFIGRNGAANFISVVGTDPTSSGAESQWWITDRGARFGIPGGDQSARNALGLGEAQVTWAPWYIVRLLPNGGELSRAAALTEHDTLAPDPAPGIVVKEGN